MCRGRCTFGGGCGRREASLPPAPGWSSISAGRSQKGWGVMREVVRRWTRVGRRVVREAMSVEARVRSSVSEEGSVRRVWSSFRDWVGVLDGGSWWEGL